MKPKTPAAPPVFVVIKDTRAWPSRLFIREDKRRAPFEVEMARATDKRTLQYLYPKAQDLTNSAKSEPGQAEAEEP